MKQCIAALSALLLTAALAGCAGQETVSPTPDSAPSETPPAVTAAPTASPAPGPTDTPARTPDPSPEQPPGQRVEGAMTHAEFLNAAPGTPVVVDAYVQAKQAWWDYKLTVYARSGDGAYFINNMGADEAEAAALTPGTHILVSGRKAEWEGEAQIIDATFELLAGEYLAPAEDLSALWGEGEALREHQNKLALFRGLTVEAVGEGEGGAVFRAGAEGVSRGFLLPEGLAGPDSELYQAVLALGPGDAVDVECFLIWKGDMLPHVTAIYQN